jgi:hypothetical protein
MESYDARRRLEEALNAFLKRDRYLLEQDLREESISARLAYHLQALFEEYDVDVEYNRSGRIPKRLRTINECVKKRDRNGTVLVLPDIVVHRRGPAGPNLLVIEIKKASNPLGLDCDRRRLQGFRDELGYCFGALLECETGNHSDIRIADWLPDHR